MSKACHKLVAVWSKNVRLLGKKNENSLLYAPECANKHTKKKKKDDTVDFHRCHIRGLTGLRGRTITPRIVAKTPYEPPRSTGRRVFSLPLSVLASTPRSSPRQWQWQRMRFQRHNSCRFQRFANALQRFYDVSASKHQHVEKTFFQSSGYGRP